MRQKRIEEIICLIGIVIIAIFWGKFAFII